MKLIALLHSDSVQLRGECVQLSADVKREKSLKLTWRQDDIKTISLFVDHFDALFGNQVKNLQVVPAEPITILIDINNNNDDGNNYKTMIIITRENSF